MNRVRHTVVTILRDIDVAIIHLSARVGPQPVRVPITRTGPRPRRE